RGRGSRARRVEEAHREASRNHRGDELRGGRGRRARQVSRPAKKRRARSTAEREGALYFPIRGGRASKGRRALPFGEARRLRAASEARFVRAQTRAGGENEGRRPAP